MSLAEVLEDEFPEELDPHAAQMSVRTIPSAANRTSHASFARLITPTPYAML